MPPLAMTTVSPAASNSCPAPSSTPRHPVTWPLVMTSDFDAMIEAQLQPVAVRPGQQVPVQDDLEFVARPPDDVPARHRVAGPVQAALDPQRHGHELDADAAQPVEDLRFARCT